MASTAIMQAGPKSLSTADTALCFGGGANFLVSLVSPIVSLGVIIIEMAPSFVWRIVKPLLGNNGAGAGRIALTA
jgi:hypothetical protein